MTYLVWQAADAIAPVFMALIAKILPKKINATVQSVASRAEVEVMLACVGLDPAEALAKLHQAVLSTEVRDSLLT